MNWTTLKDNVYYRDGSLRDIYILDTTLADWEKLINHVGQTYTAEWFNSLTDKYESKPDLSLIKAHLDDPSELISPIRIFPGKIQINIHFFCPEEIESDIDPKEFNSIEDHEIFLSYLADLSVAIEKEIIVTPENMQEFVLIRVNGNAISYENI